MDWLLPALAILFYGAIAFTLGATWASMGYKALLNDWYLAITVAVAASRFMADPGSRDTAADLREAIDNWARNDYDRENA